MSYDGNVVSLVGRLGTDPELRYTPAGKAVVTLKLAVQTGQDETMWINADVWEKTAEFANQYLKKGNRVHIIGRLRQRNWEDREGNRRSTIEVIVRELQNLTPKSDEAKPQQQQNRQGQNGGQRQQGGNQPRPAQQGGQRQNPQQTQTQKGWHSDRDHAQSFDDGGVDL